MRRKKIRFKRRFIPLILSGIKRTTIRLNRVCDVEDIIDILDENNNFISKAVILDIKVKNYSDLTLADAISDGFKDLNELKQVLKDIYGHVGDDQKIYIYFFKLI